MLTRREEDIAILEIEEKNTDLLMEWVKGKEDKTVEAAPEGPDPDQGADVGGV